MQTLELPCVAYFVADLDDMDDRTFEDRTVEDHTGLLAMPRRRSFWSWSSSLPRAGRWAMSTVVGLFLTGCADSLTSVQPPDPPAQFAYDLIFERRALSGASEIHRISLDGLSAALPVAVTIEGAFIRDPAPSPDGSKIAFTIAWYPESSSRLDGDVYVVNRDGTGLTRLTTAEDLDDEPTWSPDGTRIAFRSRRSGNDDIFVMNADGSNPVNLTDDAFPAASTELNPAWSPDGSRIAYSSDLDSFANPKLWTMRADGSDKRRVIALPVTPAPERDLEPSWSPDGARIAFRRVALEPASADIMIVNVATGSTTRLPIDGVQAAPAWSPDATLIAFQSNHEAGRFQIYTMHPDGAGVTRRATNGSDDQYPRWIRAVGR